MKTFLLSFFFLVSFVTVTWLILRYVLFRKEGSQVWESVKTIASGNKSAWQFSLLLFLLFSLITIVFTSLPTIPPPWLRSLQRLFANNFFSGGFSVFEWIALLLATIGAVFAVLARIDARQAVTASREIEQALASFQSKFHEIMEQIPEFVRGSEHSLSIMIPTPMYGFVYNETQNALEFKAALMEKLQDITAEDSTIKSIRLLLINAPIGTTTKSQAQKYLERAAESGNEDQFKSNTRAILAQLHSALENCKNQAGITVEVRVLRMYDPHVRLFVSGLIRSQTRDVNRKVHAMVVFTESTVEEKPAGTQFDASAFVSTRPEMVKSLDMLYDLFWRDADQVRAIDDNIIQEFTVR